MEIVKSFEKLKNDGYSVLSFYSGPILDQETINEEFQTFEIQPKQIKIYGFRLPFVREKDNRIFINSFNFDDFLFILSGLYFYSYIGQIYHCNITLYNLYGVKINKLKAINYFSGKFNYLMKEARHKINYSLIFDTLNNFNAEDKLSIKDFLFNWNFEVEDARRILDRKEQDTKNKNFFK